MNHESSGLIPNAELAWATEPAHQLECFQEASWLEMKPEDVFGHHEANLKLEISSS